MTGQVALAGTVAILLYLKYGSGEYICGGSMKITDKQGGALEAAFNNKHMRSMKKDEYEECLRLLFSLSLTVVRANHGDIFVKGMIDAAFKRAIKIEVIQTH